MTYFECGQLLPGQGEALNFRDFPTPIIIDIPGPKPTIDDFGIPTGPGPPPGGGGPTPGPDPEDPFTNVPGGAGPGIPGGGSTAGPSTPGPPAPGTPGAGGGKCQCRITGQGHPSYHYEGDNDCWRVNIYRFTQSCKEVSQEDPDHSDVYQKLLDDINSDPAQQLDSDDANETLGADCADTTAGKCCQGEACCADVVVQTRTWVCGDGEPGSDPVPPPEGFSPAAEAPRTGDIPKVGTPGGSGGSGGVPPGFGTYKLSPVPEGTAGSKFAPIGGETLPGGFKLVGGGTNGGTGGSTGATKYQLPPPQNGNGGGVGSTAGGYVLPPPNTENIVGGGIEFLNINTPSFIRKANQKFPTGYMNPATAITRDIPSSEPQVNNNSLTRSIFGNNIHQSIRYIQSKNNTFKDWRPNALANLTTENIINSLNDSFLKNLREIRFQDGSRLSDGDISVIVKNRLVNGTVNDDDMLAFVNMAKQSPRNIPVPPGPNSTINTVVALGLLEKNKISLDPAQSNGIHHEVAKNWKTLATDLNKYITIDVDGVEGKYYIGDNNEVIGRAGLYLQDGDFILVNGQRVYATSDVERAYYVPISIQQQVVKLLGGTGQKILSVSSSDATDLEFNYNLNLSGEDPPPDMLFFKLNLDSITTTTSRASSFLKNTTASYTLMDHTTDAGLSAIDEWVKYKLGPYGVQFIDHDDPFFYYASATETFSVSREDFSSDTAKTNTGSEDLFPRCIPWMYILFPGNRTEYLPFSEKSKLYSLNSTGAATRILHVLPTIDNRLAIENNQWLEYKNAYEEGTTDVYGGTENLQARINTFNPNNLLFKEGYRVGDLVGSLVTQKPARTKTTIRLLREIIQELDANYVIKREANGRALLEFDIISRLSMMEFNKFVTLENSTYLWNQLKNGLVNDIKIFPLTRASYTQTYTQLDRRRSTGTFPDTFPPIMSRIDEIGTYILPPSSTKPDSSSFGVPPDKDQEASRSRTR